MRRISFLILMLSAGLSGCAGNDLLVQRQGSLEGRLEQIMQTQKNTQAALASLAADVQELKQQGTRQPLADKEMLGRYEELGEKLTSISTRLSQVEAAAKKTATIELVNQESVPSGHEESVQAAYITAFGLYSANSYRAAVEAFTAFIAAYPESEYAANARYWLGECYFSLGSYPEAIESFSRVLEMNPPPKRAADTMLKVGLSWYRLDKQAKGAAVMRQLLEKYPVSEAAELARKQLNIL